MEMPPDPRPKAREPYTADEVRRIIDVCDTFGKADYERRRARAMVLLMRFYDLRISDVATLQRSRVRTDEIFLHALKNGAQIWLPLYREVELTLEAVPEPNGAPADCPSIFWNGSGIVRNHVDSVGATLRAVFRKSGVQGAHPHRFRYTRATEILVKGGTTEDAANILGDSPHIIQKHYEMVSRLPA
jgi:integrase